MALDPGCGLSLNVIITNEAAASEPRQSFVTVTETFAMNRPLGSGSTTSPETTRSGLTWAKTVIAEETITIMVTSFGIVSEPNLVRLQPESPLPYVPFRVIFY